MLRDTTVTLTIAGEEYVASFNMVAPKGAEPFGIEDLQLFIDKGNDEPLIEVDIVDMIHYDAVVKAIYNSSAIKYLLDMCGKLW